jgi:hypothetical protein
MKKKPASNRKVSQMVTKTSPWSAATAKKEFDDFTGNLVGKPVGFRAVRFGSHSPVDKKQAAADAKAVTAEPKATPVRFRYGRV